MDTQTHQIGAAPDFEQATGADSTVLVSANIIHDPEAASILAASLLERYKNVPLELANRKQWLNYRIEDRRGKPSKVPYNSRNGHYASSNKPNTWSDFPAALAASGDYDGIGYVFSEGDGLTGVDVDYPWDSPEAIEIREHFPDTYCEKSPSGNLRIFAKGKPKRCGKGTVDKKIEVYDHTSPRYLTVTGDQIEGTNPQITEQQEALDWLHDHYFYAKAPEPRQPVEPLIVIEDTEIVRRASRASNSDKFTGLMQGDWQNIQKDGVGEYDSQSEADLALCCMLAFHSADREQIDRIFRGSGLMRDKWDETHYATGETYGEHTIGKALSFSSQPPRGQFDTVEPLEGFRLLTNNDLLSLPKPKWRIKGVLPDKGLGAIYGAPGSGKSFLVIDMAMAIATGNDWFGCRTKAAPVLYVALEGEGGIANRIRAYQIANEGEIEGIRYLIQSFDLREPSAVDRLAEAIMETQGAGGIVFIDTLNRAAPGMDENSSQDMGQVINGAKRLQQHIGGLVVLVHHSGKDAGKGLRGHSSLLAALDTAIEVRRNSGARSWVVMKSKDSIDATEHGFDLQVVELGQDEDGEAMTSCVISATIQANRRRQPTGAVQQQVWSAIHELRTAPDVGVPVKDVIDRAVPFIAHDSSKQDRRRERVTRALNGMSETHLRIADNLVFLL